MDVIKDGKRKLNGDYIEQLYIDELYHLWKRLSTTCLAQFIYPGVRNS